MMLVVWSKPFRVPTILRPSFVMTLITPVKRWKTNSMSSFRHKRCYKRRHVLTVFQCLQSRGHLLLEAGLVSFGAVAYLFQDDYPSFGRFGHTPMCGCVKGSLVSGRVSVMKMKMKNGIRETKNRHRVYPKMSVSIFRATSNLPLPLSLVSFHIVHKEDFYWLKT